MKTLKFKLYDEEMEVYFVVDTYYTNSSLYIGARNKEPDEYGDDEYGDVTINLPMSPLKDNEFYGNSNSSELLKAMVKENLIEDTDETASSAYGIYNKYKLTEKFQEYILDTKD